MNYRLNVVKNKDDSYDIVLQFDKMDTEFALDFWNRKSKDKDDIIQQIQKKAKGLKIASLRIMVAGTLIASMAWAGMSSALAASDKYSMSYLYFGSTNQQIEYVMNTQNSLHTVSPSYFDINAAGDLVLNTVSKSLVDSMHEIGIKVVPFLSNHWDRQAGVQFLNNIDKWTTQIAGYIQQYNLDGINVDIENVTHLQRDAYTEFVAQLRAKIPAGKEVSVAVAANPNGWTEGWHGSYDYAKLAQHADYLMIMTYDEHYQGGDAGPVASYGFVEKSIQYALRYAPSKKIVLGLPFYGRIWGPAGTLQGYGLSIKQTESIAQLYNGKITYDNISRTPKLEFTVKATDPTTTVGGKVLAPGNYVIWHDNNQSIQEKLKIADQYDLKGAGSWALGQEPASIWGDYSKWLNGGSAQSGSTTPSTPSTSTSAASTQTGVVAATSLNIRSGGSTSDKIIANVTNGTKLTILGKASTGWYQVKLANGTVGYASNQYIKLDNTASTPSTSAPSTSTPSTNTSTAAKTGVVSGTTSLNIRSSGSTSGKVVATVKSGTKLTILGTASTGWYQVKLANGTVGYASNQYIKLDNTASTPSTSAPSTSTPSTNTSTAAKTGVVSGTTSLNIRSSGSTSGKVVATVKSGTKMTILGTASTGWYQVRLANGTVGYASNKYIKPV